MRVVRLLQGIARADVVLLREPLPSVGRLHTGGFGKANDSSPRQGPGYGGLNPCKIRHHNSERQYLVTNSRSGEGERAENGSNPTMVQREEN